MIILPSSLNSQIQWFESFCEKEFGQHWTHNHPVLIAVELGFQDNRQADFFDAVVGQHWLDGTSKTNRITQVAALARHLERLATERANVRPFRASYPYVVPPHLEGKIRKLAHDIGKTPELALCALLAITIGYYRACAQMEELFSDRLPREIASFAA